MTRGTTPTHRFNVDLDLTDAEVIYVTYKQLGRVVIEKTGEDLTVANDHIDIRLSQAETLSLSATAKVEIQVRARFHDGTAVASNIINTTTNEILKQGEI